MAWHPDDHQAAHRALRPARVPVHVHVSATRAALVLAVLSLLLAWALPITWPQRLGALLVGLVLGTAAHLITRRGDR